jgi:KipI family sensor histidine kinase inhibitor
MTVRCLPMGETALLVVCGDLAQVRQVDAALRAAELPWLRDTVPAYDSVLVIGVPGSGHHLDALAADLPAWPLPPPDPMAGREVTIEVAYDGPDMDDVCALTGLAKVAVVAMHTAPGYTVAFLGFSPGFPYLLGLDPRLRVPRLSTPRQSVPAGSVGIGGDQTGVYPSSTPGGWRLIGRTDATLFDPTRDPVTMLQAGDTVRFVAR